MKQLHILILTILCCVTIGCQSPAAKQLKPIPPGRSLWSGSWTSEEYTNIRGNVAALLPTELSTGESFNVPVAIYYKMFTFYRAGNTVEMRLEANIAADNQSAGDNVEAPIMAPGLRIQMFSKGGLGPTHQVIRYEAKFDRGDKVIEGSYTSSNPFDRGKFRLKLKEAG